MSGPVSGRGPSGALITFDELRQPPGTTTTFALGGECLGTVHAWSGARSARCGLDSDQLPGPTASDGPPLGVIAFSCSALALTGSSSTAVRRCSPSPSSSGVNSLTSSEK